MHRPKGLGRVRFDDSQKLTTDICTTSVISKGKFKCSETKGQYHPYKQYMVIYPDWEIAGDPSMETSDYWKSVLMKHNEEFADWAGSETADIPPAWKELKPTDAQIGLRKSFNMGADKSQAD